MSHPAAFQATFSSGSSSSDQATAWSVKIQHSIEEMKVGVEKALAGDDNHVLAASESSGFQAAKGVRSEAAELKLRRFWLEGILRSLRDLSATPREGLVLVGTKVLVFAKITPDRDVDDPPEKGRMLTSFYSMLDPEVRMSIMTVLKMSIHPFEVSENSFVRPTAI